MPPSRGRLLAVPPRRRLSLRARVSLAIMIVSAAPLLLVYVWSQLDKPVRTATRVGVQRAASAAADVAGDEGALAHVASAHEVRLRILDATGATRFDENRDDPSDAFGPVEAFFLGPRTRPSVARIDVELGPLSTREVLRSAARHGTATRCSLEPRFYVCETAHVADGLVVHAQASSYRSIESVYALRFALGRLALVLTPLALALALFTGRRIVEPIDALRRRALQQAAAETPSALFEAESPDEVAVLASAFDSLVLALDGKRRENQSFVADLVHELKNPIAATRAVAESLESGGVTDERAARLARALSESARKLDILATQFLELARAEAGMPNEERERVDLLAVVEAIVERAKSDVRFAHVAFSCDSAAPAAAVFAVPHRIDAIVTELVENAASFASKPGHVRVRVIADAREVRVEVRDDGPGLPESDVARVFDRFFTTRGRARGTGLGLALVKAVVEAHDGRVFARNEGGAVLAFALARA